MRRTLELMISPILLCIVASALGSLALFAIAVGLALVYFGLYAAVRRAETRIAVVRKVRHHEVVEGTPVEISFEVGGLDGLPVGVERYCACGKWHELPLGTTVIGAVIHQPGRHLINPSLLRLRDDLGLFKHPILVGEPQEVLVLPAPAPVPARDRRGAMDLALDPEPDGLKTYVRGTPMSRIHWPSMARGAELQERAFTSSRDHLPLVVVDTGGLPSGAAVDWAAREAAGHVLALARAGGCRVLLPGDRSPTTLMDPSAHWPAVHRRLAALQRGTPATGQNRIELRDAVHVSAAMAPEAALAPRRKLPPGVVGLGDWAEA